MEKKTEMVRAATPDDVHDLRALIDASVRGLQIGDYSETDIERALATVYGVDTQLIADGTYYVVEVDGEIVGCGGWSKRATLFGGDQYAAREDSLLDPSKDAAKIRAFFVHPNWARRGIGTAILDACEDAARRAGFTRFELGATLTGVPFYAARGYTELDRLTAPIAIVRMLKTLHPS
jgi:GNAT superfamily N-acetyltransferase